VHGFSWCTRIVTENADSTPFHNRDLAVPMSFCNTQHRSRIAFRMVWCPENFDNFVIVDQDGDVLTRGRLDGAHDLPPLRERQMAWDIIKNSVYSLACRWTETPTSPTQAKDIATGETCSPRHQPDESVTD
jgi:hypothetical protein